MKIKLSSLCVIIFLGSISFSCSSNGKVNSDSSKEIIQSPDTKSKKELIAKMEKVLDWQIANFSYKEEGSGGYLHDYGIDAWTNGVLYLGASEFAKIATKSTDYYTWLLEIGNKSQWLIPANFKDNEYYSLYHADELCIGQFYIDMYRKYNDSKMIESTKERIDWIIANPPGDEMKGKKSWTWCDALFMAPPVYANIAAIGGDNKYLNFMHKEFEKTYNHLYDKEEKLFYRDGSYFDKTEVNGKKIFWGRGNGWVVAGIANLFKVLPNDDPKKEFYTTLFQTMIERLAELRGKDSFWHASLLDPDSYPSPETSATAMIVYAMAYGVNNGYLDKDKYTPIITSSWEALESVITPEGKLGFVQPIGADPKKVTEDMTAVYGVGALLMAGSEIYKMN